MSDYVIVTKDHLYYSASGGEERWAGMWTHDASKAVRFADAMSAERMLGEGDWPAGVTVQEVAG